MVQAEPTVDLAVGGTDLLALLLACVAARQGRKIALLTPASKTEALPGKARTIRAIGMLQARDGREGSSVRHREKLFRLLSETGYQPDGMGMLLPAYHEREFSVLEALVLAIGSFDVRLSLLTPEESVRLAPWLNPVRLEGSLLVPDDFVLDDHRVRAHLLKYLVELPNVLSFPLEALLSWQAPVLEGSGFRIRARKIYLRRMNMEKPQGFGQADWVDREQVLPTREGSGRSVVHLGWLHCPPPIFSLVETTHPLLPAGFPAKPPGRVFLLPQPDSRLLLHQHGPGGDPGKERLFARLQKAVRNFREEELNWNGFWDSEKLSPRPVADGLIRGSRIQPAAEKRTSPGPWISQVEAFLRDQGPGFFQA